MHRIHIQYITDKSLAPKSVLLRKWAKCALSQKKSSSEITIRIVDEKEIMALNKRYRRQNKPTNVLSFPFEMPKEIEVDDIFLGDIVICAAVVNQEAKEQHKTQEAHWAHMIVHGIFHLLGYDHETDHDAMIMEKLETDVMITLGFNDPYQIAEESKRA